MIRGKIQNALSARNWTVRQLADDAGVRYPSITEYLAGKKELSTQNLEKICQTLGLELRPGGGSKFYDYDRLIKAFNGGDLINCETDFGISECEFAHYLCGVLVHSAAAKWADELKNPTLSWGHVWDNMVSETWINGRKVIDIAATLSKRELVRMAELHFNEKEKLCMAALLAYEYPEGCNRESMVAVFMSGTFREYEIAP